MQNLRGDVMSRLGGSANTNNHRLFKTRVEYVNRAGEVIHPHNGKPYNRPVGTSPQATNGQPKKKRYKKSNERRLLKKQEKKLAKFPVRTTGSIFGGLTLIETDPKIDPPPKVCYNCWQPGHAKKNCPRPIIVQSCNNCGRRGVTLATCPRCQKAYVRYVVQVRGETLDKNDLEKHFPEDYYFESEGVYNKDKPLDDGIHETLQQLIERDDRVGYYDDEHDKEMAYPKPQVKYVETREYVKNPVSRYRESHEYADHEEISRRHEEFDYSGREGSYDERRERDKFPRYRERESSEDRSVERNRYVGNMANTDLDSDPVQEILQLAKSIAHLSPETQELIMKQVMAERKEKARLRAIQETVDEDWP